MARRFVYRGDARRETAVHAKELTVHDSRQRESIKGFNAQIIQSSVIFVNACGDTMIYRPRASDRTTIRTFFLECEVRREVAALMVAADHPECLREADLQSVHVKHNLHREGT